MPYIDCKAIVKNAQIKKDGVVEIKLEASVNELNGQFNHLSKMVGEKVEISMESAVVTFNVTLNAKSNKPVQEYRVNQNGVVEEVKPSYEQLKADKELGLPKEDVPTKDEKREMEREKVDQFIQEGLAPNFDDFPKDFANIVKRRLEGESYLKLANELDMSSGKIVEMVDDYRKRVAPLAQKWWEWKKEREGDNDAENTPEPKEDDNKEKGEGAA